MRVQAGKQVDGAVSSASRVDGAKKFARRQQAVETATSSPRHACVGIRSICMRSVQFRWPRCSACKDITSSMRVEKNPWKTIHARKTLPALTPCRPPGFQAECSWSSLRPSAFACLPEMRRVYRTSFVVTGLSSPVCSSRHRDCERQQSG